MTRKQMRSLIFTQVQSFNTDLANVYYENLKGPIDKGENWIRASIRFGVSSAVALGTSQQVGILFIQVFTTVDAGGSVKDGIIDGLVTIFDYKTFTDSSGLIQFRGGTEAVAPSDGGYIQSQYSIPFDHYKEIA